MIPRLQKGESPSLLDTDKANEIIDTINAITNSKGENGIEIQSDQSGGLTISIRDETANPRHYEALEIIEVTPEFISVNPGTINNELITPVGGIDYNESSNTQYLSVEVSINNDSEITSAELKIDGSPPESFKIEKDKAPGDFKVLIATINALSFFQIRTGNLTATVSEQFQTPKDQVDIGEYDHDIYYSWQVS